MIIYSKKNHVINNLFVILIVAHRRTVAKVIIVFTFK